MQPRRVQSERGSAAAPKVSSRHLVVYLARGAVVIPSRTISVKKRGMLPSLAMAVLSNPRLERPVFYTLLFVTRSLKMCATLQVVECVSEYKTLSLLQT